MNTIQRILVLDDSAEDKARMAAAFDELPFGWKVQFAPTAADALRELSAREMDIVVASLQSGPEAIEFLDRVFEFRPEILRFIAAEEAIIPQIAVPCALGAHQIISKPLEGGDVYAALGRASCMNRMARDPAVRNMVARVRTFPAKPSVYIELMRELRSPTASAQTVADIVKEDLGISTKLIQVINSAAFGVSQEVLTPDEAVLFLGMEITASLVLGIEAFSRLEQNAPQWAGIDQVWRHSQVVAQEAKRITERVTGDRTLAHEAFTAGILHDLGKLCLALNLDAPYKEITLEARERNLPLWEVETEKLGTTHAEAGAYLLGVWGLPAPIIEAVANHHAPARTLEGKFSATTAVHLANALEYAKNSLQCGFPEFRLDLNYPTVLGLHAHFDEIRSIVSFPRGSGATEIFESTKAACEEAAILEETVELAELPRRRWWSRLFARGASVA